MKLYYVEGYYTDVDGDTLSYGLHVTAADPTQAIVLFEAEFGKERGDAELDDEPTVLEVPQVASEPMVHPWKRVFPQ